MTRAWILGLMTLAGCVGVGPEDGANTAPVPLLRIAGAPVFALEQTPEGKVVFVFASEEAPQVVGAPVPNKDFSPGYIEAWQQVRTPEDQPAEVVLVNPDGTLCYGTAGRTWRFVRVQPDWDTENEMKGSVWDEDSDGYVQTTAWSREDVVAYGFDHGTSRFAAEIEGCDEATNPLSLAASTAPERHAAFARAPAFAPSLKIAEETVQESRSLLAREPEYIAKREEFYDYVEIDMRSDDGEEATAESLLPPTVEGWDVDGTPLLRARRSFATEGYGCGDYGDSIRMLMTQESGEVMRFEQSDLTTPDSMSIANFDGEWFIIDWAAVSSSASWDIFGCDC